MIDLDDELAEEYFAESRDHLATVRAGLLDIEAQGAAIDDETVNRVFRAVHSIKGGAGFFDLVGIRELAHKTEDILALIRSHKLVPTPERVGVLLRATDRLKELLQDPGRSNQVDLSQIFASLAKLPASERAAAKKSGASLVHPAQKRRGNLRVLLAEDDFPSRLLLQTFLARYGECHVAVNGKEAVEAVRSSWERGETYDLICMDIMMPEMDGREAVRQVRAIEQSHGTLSTDGARIIMTTTVDDVKEVIRCFRELCDAYLIKPIDLASLLSHMKSYQLIQ